MRFVEIPKMVFDEIVKVEQGDVLEFSIYDNTHCVLFLRNSKAIMVFNYAKTGVGKNSFLKVWDFKYRDDFKPADFDPSILFEPPMFELIAGPFLDPTKYDIELGFKIIETMKGCYANIDFSLDSPCHVFIDRIKGTAVLMVEDLQPTPHEYWARFVDSRANYLDPIKAV